MSLPRSKTLVSQHADQTRKDELVRVENVNLSFPYRGGGEVRVLKDVSLSVRPGEVLGILGPSGCGKSSLLRLIAGLQLPTSGQCKIEQELLEQRGLELAMVFQTPALMPWQSVAQNIVLPYVLAGKAIDAKVIARTEQLLKLVRLHGFSGSRPHELSGGMRSRVALVRAFVTEPRLALMDEPFSALDEETRVDLCLELLHLVARTNAAVVFVTHSVQEAALVSSRVVQLSPRPGRIVAEWVSPFSGPRDRRLLDDPRFQQFCANLRSKIPHDQAH